MKLKVYPQAALVGVAIAVLGAPAYAKEPTKSTSKKPASVAVTMDARTSFDPSLDALPSNFAGHPFMAVYESVVLVRPKGEFETTAEYEKRSRSSSEIASVLAFVSRDAEFDGIEVVYDADRQAMHVVVEPFRADIGLAGDQMPGYLIDRRVTNTKRVPASNAFGATSLIEKRAQEYRVLTLPATGPLSGGAEFTFPLPLTDAPRVEPRLRVLFIGSATAAQHPPIKVEGARWNGYNVIDATIDDPLEVSTGFFNLNFEVADVWVFDQQTGEVYAKHSAQPNREAMKLSVYTGENGYASVTVAGNDRLSLTRSGDGRCHIAVSSAFEIVRLENGAFSSGNVVGIRDASVRVTRADGSVAFDEPAAKDRSGTLKQLIAPGSVLHAAQLMWAAAPGGYVEVRGGDSRFEGKASLAGFRELWRWGIEHCALPSFNPNE